MMTTSNPAEELSVPAPAVNAKPARKPRAGARRAHAAPSEAKSGKKATPAKKTPTPRKSAGGSREASKTAKVLELLRRPGGATAKELMKATGWQPHSVRGFLSGTVGEKMGLSLTSSKGEDGERTYSVKS
jgi:Protein of unknown function (DUF3489)